ncbi:MAG TPA: Clp protease N-terminal domain-containing protein, partial [Polyangia bacterium]
MSRASKAEGAPPAVSADGSLPLASADHQAAMAHAARLAESFGRGLTSLDVLLGMLHVGGSAGRLLAERGVTSTTVEVLGAKVRPDYGVDPVAVAQASREIAIGLSAPQTTSLHLLLALMRSGGSAADTLRLAGQDPAKLRGVVMRVLTGPSAQYERRISRAPGLQPTAALVDKPATVAAKDVAREPEDAIAWTAHAASIQSDWSLLPVAPPHIPVLYREREVGRLLDLLQAKTARVIAIVGEPGSGRSALLSALSAASLQPPVLPTGDMGSPASAGAMLQGFHRRAPLVVPIVLEGAAWLGPEGGDGVLQLLACAGAGRRWILCLTPADLRRIEINTPDLMHNLETVLLALPEPTPLHEMIEVGLDALATESGVAFASDVATTLLRLSARYPCERAQPGRALSIAEVAVARAGRMTQTEISARDIAAVVGDASGVPASQLLRDDDERFRTLDARLADRVVGHAEPRAKIASV